MTLTELKGLSITLIMQIRVFNIDYAGLFHTKCDHKRSITKFKFYICFFMCIATKTVHHQLVFELSTACFLAVLCWFISRRGCQSKIISDSGSNFKGATRQLKALFLFCREKKCRISALLRVLSCLSFLRIYLILEVCEKQQLKVPNKC